MISPDPLNRYAVGLWEAQDTDCGFFYELRTDPTASRNSRRPPPSWEDHLRWFFQNPPTEYRFVAYQDDMKVGIIRLSYDGVVSIIVAPAHRGKGIGSEMLRKLDYEARHLGFTHLLAEIVYDNIPSQRAFLKNQWRPVVLEKCL